MRCPGCNFVCSELRDICPQCVSDLRSYKHSVGLPITNSSATYEELLASVRSPKKRITPSVSSESRSFFGGLVSSFFGVDSPSHSEVKGPCDERQHTTFVPVAEHPCEPPPLLSHSDSPVPEQESSGVAPSLPVESEIPSTIEPEVKLIEDSDTSIVITDFPFPDLSFANVASPTTQVCEWVIPSEIRTVESERALIAPKEYMEHIIALPSDALADEGDFEGMYSTEIPSEPEERPFEEQLPHTTEIIYPVTTTWGGCRDEVESCFSEAFTIVQELTANSNVFTENFFVRSSVDREQISLAFSLALDEIEGRTRHSELEVQITSDKRELRSDELILALGAVEAQVSKAEQPAPLREFIHDQLAEAKHHDQELIQSSDITFIRRTLAGLIDIGFVLFLSSLLTSLLEPGGLTAILATISIEGIRTNHLTWLIASVSITPAFLIAYSFVTLCLLDGTFGSRILGYSYRIPNGRPIRTKHIVVRALTTPVLAILGGALPTLWSARPLGDIISASVPYATSLDEYSE